MTKSIQKVSATVLALGALGLGGSAIAQAASSPESTTGPDRDNIQAGDQTTPDVSTVTASARKPTAANAGTGARSSAVEQPGVESTTETPGSESAASSDGPGGHADEPGNANADHQFQGAE
jgi:hypothetical protein